MDRKPTLHVLGIPHSRPWSEMSHCAFSGKVRRFGPMMALAGYDCVHYGIGEPDTSGWADHVDVMSTAEQCALLGYDPTQSGAQFVGRDANVGHPLYVEFNKRLRGLLLAKVRPQDTIILPFGHAHGAAVEGALMGQCIEQGIGYPTCLVGYRIYESYAWMHWHLGTEGRMPWISEWVVPNYFDAIEWPLRQEAPKPSDYLLYMGRIIKVKGLNVILQLALSRPDLHFVICGQGDPKDWLDPKNLEYRAPVHGMDRARLIHGARAVLMPTEYVEPFGGVAIEAMLTGTPCIASDHSAFTETIPAAFRCHHHDDWIAAIEFAQETYSSIKSCEAMSNAMISRYSLAVVARKFDRIFQQLPALRKHGWAMHPPKALPMRAPKNKGKSCGK